MGIRSGKQQEVKDDWWIDRDFVTGYRTDDPQQELFRHLEQRVSGTDPVADTINRCRSSGCAESGDNPAKNRADRALRKILDIQGRIVAVLPDVAFLRVRLGGRPEDDLAYTLISNKAYKHVRSMFADEKLGDRRDYENDTQTVVDWLEGAYPNFFYIVDLEQIEAFTAHYGAIANRDDYEQFVARYGMRRTNPRFWSNADWFHERYKGSVIVKHSP